MEVQTMAGYSDHKEDVQKRLRRVEGQVRGLQRMVGEDAYCIDVLTQISAATKALQSVALELLGEHLSHCVQDAIQAGGPEADSKVSEAREAIERLVRPLVRCPPSGVNPSVTTSNRQVLPWPEAAFSSIVV